MNALRQRELRHFLLLDRNQQTQAIRRLITCGMSEYTAAAVTGLAVEQIRRIVAEHRQPDRVTSASRMAAEGNA